MNAILVIWFAPALLALIPTMLRAYDACKRTVAWLPTLKRLPMRSPLLASLAARITLVDARIENARLALVATLRPVLAPNMHLRLAYLALA